MLFGSVNTDSVTPPVLATFIEPGSFGEKLDDLNSVRSGEGGVSVSDIIERLFGGGESFPFVMADFICVYGGGGIMVGD